MMKHPLILKHPLGRGTISWLASSEMDHIEGFSNVSPPKGTQSTKWIRDQVRIGRHGELASRTMACAGIAKMPSDSKDEISEASARTTSVKTLLNETGCFFRHQPTLQ
jgi:hypothetical protein